MTTLITTRHQTNTTSLVWVSYRLLPSTYVFVFLVAAKYYVLRNGDCSVDVVTLILTRRQNQTVKECSSY